MNVQTELMRTLVAVKWLRKAFLAMAPQLIPVPERAKYFLQE